MITSSPPPRIFVSYSHRDNSFGVKLVQDLRRVLGDNTAVWDTSDGHLQGDSNPWPEILKHLTARNIFIFVLSPDATASPWVKSEIDIALRRHVLKTGKLIPVSYRKCKVPDGFDALYIVSFRYKLYEIAFNELLVALGLPAKKIGIILLVRVLQLLLMLLLVVVSTGSISLNYKQATIMPRVNPSPTVHTSVTSTAPTVTITALPNLYPNPTGTVVNDPLNGGCQFSKGSYHISASGQLEQLGQFSLNSCNGGDSFSNFAFEIQMTIVKGDFGGIIFRYGQTPLTAPSQIYYAFLIGSDRTYDLIIPGSAIKNLAKGSSPFIKKGQNTLAVVAKGPHIDLYVNQRYIVSVNDSTISQGQVGIIAAGVNNPTDVTFTDAKVWKF